MKAALLIGLLLLLLPSPASAVKTYEAPTLSSIPREPHVRQTEGTTLRLAPWILTVPPDTFSYDVYFQHGCAVKSFLRSLGRYWQISDICDFHPRSHFNQARAVPNRAWMITLTYTDGDLEFLPGLAFPENSLRIVYSPDYGKSWEMLRSSIVDTTYNSVAAITDRPGGYMVMAGFVSPGTYYSYKEVKGVFIWRGSLLDRVLAFVKTLLGWF